MYNSTEPTRVNTDVLTIISSHLVTNCQLDLGLGAKSPGLPLASIQCTVCEWFCFCFKKNKNKTIQDGLSDLCSNRKARSSRQGQLNNPQKADR